MSLNLKDPSTREEIEALLKTKIESGEVEPGLFDTGLLYVVATMANGAVDFKWFANATPVSDLFQEEEVMDWERVEPPIWWEDAKMWVVADRHLPNGVRQHMVRGHVPEGLVIANAQVISEDDAKDARFSDQLSHLSRETCLICT